MAVLKGLEQRTAVAIPPGDSSHPKPRASHRHPKRTHRTRCQLCSYIPRCGPGARRTWHSHARRRWAAVQENRHRPNPEPPAISPCHSSSNWGQSRALYRLVRPTYLPWVSAPHPPQAGRTSNSPHVPRAFRSHHPLRAFHPRHSLQRCHLRRRRHRLVRSHHAPSQARPHHDPPKWHPPPPRPRPWPTAPPTLPPHSLQKLRSH